MRNSLTKRNLARLIVVCIGLCSFAVLSTARTQMTSVDITNNSSRAIISVYLSHVDLDDWSANQLTDGATIAPGQSFNLTNVVCDQPQVKVIGEDADGCFVSTVVTCGQNSTWTVTNDTARDCGN